LKNNPQFVPLGQETQAEFLLLIRRDLYRARLVTSCAIHLAEAGEWCVEIQGETVVVTFPKGRILDSQNRPWVTKLLSVVPAEIVIPYGYPVSVSGLGLHPRYYLQFPRACSLTIESTVSIDAKPKSKAQ
jgi:hypothetical protein